MYSEYLWKLQAEVNALGQTYVEATDETTATACFHKLYGIALTLHITNEWSKHWANYFANATRDTRIDTDILEHFDFLND